jgi:hypothetical protein
LLLVARERPRFGAFLLAGTAMADALIQTRCSLETIADTFIGPVSGWQLVPVTEHDSGTSKVFAASAALLWWTFIVVVIVALFDVQAFSAFPFFGLDCASGLFTY